MHYATIKKYDIANGPGVRVSFFVSGCTHHCKECFNPETWNFNYGTEYSQDTEEEILNALSSPHITGLTLLGGEPFEPENQKVLVKLLRKVKTQMPHKTIWCYSGYLLDKDLIEGGSAHCEVTDEIISYLDVLVDGEFKIELKDIRLNFRGSANQRIIDMKEYNKSKNIITIF